VDEIAGRPELQWRSTGGPVPPQRVILLPLTPMQEPPSTGRCDVEPMSVYQQVNRESKPLKKHGIRASEYCLRL
jgi:hypothetical protein